MPNHSGRQIFVFPYSLFTIPCLLTLVFLSSALAGTTFNTLKLQPGARPGGMGEAFVGLSDDANVLFWNPAGGTEIKEGEVILFGNKWINGMTQGFVGVVQPLVKNNKYAGQSIGGGILYFDQGSTEIIGPQGEVLDTAKARDMVFNFLFAQKLQQKISAGVNLKLLQSTLYDQSATGFALDGGFYLSLSPAIFAGVLAQNLGSKLKYEEEQQELPLTYKGGIGIKIVQSRDNRLNLAADYTKPRTGEDKINVGGEYWLKNVALRVGYKNTEKELTYGAGFKLEDLRIDYAYMPYKELEEVTHRVSLTYEFGSPLKKQVVKKKKITYQPEPEEELETEIKSIDIQKEVKKKNLPIKKDRRGLVIVLPIRFPSGVAEIYEADYPVLAQIAGILKSYPEYDVRLEGYIDSAEQEYLGQKRADAVFDYLVNEGKVNASRLIPQSFGKTNPVASNRSKEGRARNRRVDFVLLTKGKEGSKSLKSGKQTEVERLRQELEKKKRDAEIRALKKQIDKTKKQKGAGNTEEQSEEQDE